MELKLNSLSARLYRYFYETNKMPNSLCTYFWKLVIAYLLIIPLEIIGLPCTIYGIYIKFFGKDQTPTQDYSYPNTKAGASSIFFIVLFVMLVPIIQFFIPIRKSLVIETLSFDIIIIFTIVCYCLKNSNFLVKDFIKAKVKKVCPKINWN